MNSFGVVAAFYVSGTYPVGAPWIINLFLLSEFTDDKSDIR